MTAKLTPLWTAAALTVATVLPALAQDAAAPVEAAAPAPAPEATAPAAAETPQAPPAPVVVAEPAPPPPVMPTTGDEAVIIGILDKVCKPLIAGGNLEALAKAAGMTKDRSIEKYVALLPHGKPYQVALEPQGSNNRHVCELTVTFAPGWDSPIREGLNIWGALQDVRLNLQRNEVASTLIVQQTSTTWNNRQTISRDGELIGLTFIQQRKPDGTPINPRFESARVQYSKTKDF